jgi:hypothetical protein
VWVLVQLKVKEEAHIKCATTELVQSEINIETIQVIYVSYQKEGEQLLDCLDVSYLDNDKAGPFTRSPPVMIPNTVGKIM